MIRTWPITNTPIPPHIVVIRGIWLDREHIAGPWMQWAKERSERGTTWERRFMRGKIEEAKNALERK